MFLLAFSLLVASPVRFASAATPAPAVSLSVGPTLLTGYKQTGELPSSTPVVVTVGIPLLNQQSLEYLTQEISTPGSPLYHDFISQAQAQSFLPVVQYEAAVAYLQQAGLTITSSSLDSIIIAQGTAGQVTKSMGLTLDMFSNGTSSYYAASGVSPIPGAYVYSSNVTAVLLSHPPDLVTQASISALRAKTAQSNQTAPIEAFPPTDLQSVYNATSLYAKGDTGKGYTAGILDFYGDPYIAQQLEYYDGLFGIASSTLNVIPIEAYNPSLGGVEGWSPEISLDVESVHTMAPGATIDLYIANGALPLAAAIAAVVAQDKVDDLSQSFGFPESFLSSTTPSTFELNVALTDEYYMLGSAEGITFISSTGDVGGSGNAGGPLGTPGYPSTSPYVTAVGGTTTYMTFNGYQVTSSYETAWSNYGFVPDQINYGGGTGGVSDVEPRPWYQSSLTSPPGYPSGREVPDISLNANVYPGGIFVLPGNGTYIVGGTSEASPLFAGLLTLLMSSAKSELGLINPGLYGLAESPSLYTKDFYPISFGYTIPWVSTPGYNMATGWGAPNIGEMAHSGLTAGASKTLGVNVTVAENGAPPVDVLPGSVLSVSATVTNGASIVTSGSFTAELDTLTGTLITVPLSYDSKLGTWTGQLAPPQNASGLAYVTVKGSSGALSGTGFATIFAGYLADFISPSPDVSYDSDFGTLIVANVTTLTGEPVNSGRFSVNALSYSLASNSYSKDATVPVFGGFGAYWEGVLNGKYPYGPMVFTGNDGVYGYLPILNGAGLQGTFIETTVLAEPGAVAPGQSIFVLASILPPANLPAVLSLETGLPVEYDVEEGSNVTVSLVSQAGVTVASQTLYSNDFLTSIEAIQGALTVPYGIAPGLYNIILHSSFDSYTLGAWVNGSYFGQVYVAPTDSVPKISITPAVQFQGESVAVSAKIDYSNGSAVKYGMYSATVYPEDLQNYYNTLTGEIPVPLWYQSSTGLWTGNATLPSAYNAGGSTGIDPGALYLSGPYEVFVSGLSADGVPSSTEISTQQQIQIQPYFYISDQDLISLPQTSQVAFSNDVISVPSSLSGDLFTGTNTLEGGAFSVSSSQINGTLYIKNAQVTLTGVTGGTVIAQDSKLTIRQSSLQSLQLTAGSTVSLNGTTLTSITPSIPAISVQSPVASENYNGTEVAFTVSGQQVSSVSVYLDGSLLATMGGGSQSYTVPLNAESLSPGVHALDVVATQQDGMSGSTTVLFSSEGKLAAINSTLNSEVSSASSTIGSLNTRLSSDQSTINSLKSSVNTLTYGMLGLGVVAVIALVVAIAAVGRRGTPKQEASPPPPPPPSPPSEQPQWTG